MAGAPLLATESVAARPKPPVSQVLASPDSRPVRAVTNFSEALTCMDDLLLQYGKKDIRVMTDGIPDSTETLKLGTRDMMISALDAMSTRSRAFRFVDVDQSAANVMAMTARVNGRMATADFYIKGSITQIDQDVASDGKRAGAAIKQFSIGASSDRSVSNITLEMSVYNVSDHELIPGVRTQNTIEVVRSGKGTNVEGLLPFASLTYEVHKDRAQGSHQAVRTLLELSMIELMGKFTRVPYWRCLSIPSTDPMARKTSQDYYSAMAVRDRVVAVQTGLATAGVYTGRADGTISPELAGVITRYRVEKNLSPGPNVDFELYFSLLANGLIGHSANANGRDAPLGVIADAPIIRDLTIKVEPSATVLRRGESLRLGVTPSQDAYVYCYMDGGLLNNTRTSVRIYPNRFAGGQLVPAGEQLVIPDDSGNFTLRMNDVGEEKIACMARTKPFASPEPASIRMTDLVPFNGSLSMVIDNLQGYSDKTDALNSTVQMITVTVTAAQARQ